MCLICKCVKTEACVWILTSVAIACKELYRVVFGCNLMWLETSLKTTGYGDVSAYIEFTSMFNTVTFIVVLFFYASEIYREYTLLSILTFDDSLDVMAESNILRIQSLSTAKTHALRTAGAVYYRAAVTALILYTCNVFFSSAALITIVKDETTQEERVKTLILFLTHTSFGVMKVVDCYPVISHAEGDLRSAYINMKMRFNTVRTTPGCCRCIVIET